MELKTTIFALAFQYLGWVIPVIVTGTLLGLVLSESVMSVVMPIWVIGVILFTFAWIDKFEDPYNDLPF